MKKIQNKTLIILGLICGLIPTYKAVSWFRHFYLTQDLEHLQRVEKYRQDFLFGYSGEFYKLGLITVLIGAISIACFGILLNQTNRIKNKRKARISMGVYLTLLIVVSVFTFFQIWGMM